MSPHPKVFPRFVPIAEHAVLVEFSDTITPEAHEAVLALDAQIATASPAGVTDVVPGMVNLLVEFDPMISDHKAIMVVVRSLIGSPRIAIREPRKHDVSVCYEEPFSTDLNEVAARTGLSEEAVIAEHLSGTYEVFMYGFAPGYAYLAGLPAALRLDRKSAPLPGVAAGSVIIAGAQALVTTLRMPTGWWIIGRSPTRILTGEDASPFLFDVGDLVRFRRISLAEFEAQTPNV
ncbi:5-oxoprolinase subunit B family protein [Thioclava sp. FR2]|uniref:5-oxoprolinase subunit B family protein n=1 Tax=Thioclava sp. FR2 TaxID=3445780 RepID=UPI003EBAD3B0